MNLKKRIILGLAGVLLCPVVHAAEPEGYIFRLNPDGPPIEIVANDIQQLSESEGVYRTEDLSLVEELDEQGALEYCVRDEMIELFGYEEDLETLQSEPWSRAMLGADYATEQGITGQGVRVGLIDSGLIGSFSDYSEAEIIPGTNYCVSAGSLRRNDTTDSFGHGTFVASVLASNEVGLAPQVEIVPLKCFDGNQGDVSSVVSAIYEAVDVYHCDVINLSLGMTTENVALRDAVTYASEQGTILVGACGNLETGKTSTGDDPLYYPAAYDEVISVGSVDAKKTVAAHSIQNPSVCVVAPGQQVRGLSYRTGKYVVGNGTSYAAPLVAATAALALSVDPALTAGEFQSLLKQTAQDLGDPGRDNAYGCGLLNLGLLLAAVKEDSVSVIPSYYAGTLCLSSYQPAVENGVTWLARYEKTGKFFSLEALAAGENVNNRALSADAPLVRVMTVDKDRYAPLCKAAAYGTTDSMGGT